MNIFPFCSLLPLYANQLVCQKKTALSSEVDCAGHKIFFYRIPFILAPATGYVHLPTPYSCGVSWHLKTPHHLCGVFSEHTSCCFKLTFPPAHGTNFAISYRGGVLRTLEGCAIRARTPRYTDFYVEHLSSAKILWQNWYGARQS